MSINNATNVAWEIKIQSCSLVTIVLYRNDIHELAISLQQKLAQTPRFFHETPIILAFTDEAEAIEIDTLQKVFDILTRYKLKPIAFQGQEGWVEQLSQFFSIPLLNQGNWQAESVSSVVLTEPLRAGQQRFSQQDMICLSPIHSGAEVISQGHIHCYAPAHGRLLAGVNGNKHARLFCQNASMELVSICGVYLTRKQIPKHILGHPCVFYLENDEIAFQEMKKDMVYE